jgi:hypothetical protein
MSFGVVGLICSGENSDRLRHSFENGTDVVEFVVCALPPDKDGGSVTLKTAKAGDVQKFEAGECHLATVGGHVCQSPFELMDFNVFVFFSESIKAGRDHLLGPWAIREQPEEPEAGVIGGHRQHNVLPIGFLFQVPVSGIQKANSMSLELCQYFVRFCFHFSFNFFAMKSCSFSVTE